MSNGDSTLFSIDVDSHLRSAATHTFGSPAHYPVELVRAALRRGARKVEVRIGRDRIQVTDDGAGLDSVWLETLSNLLEPVRPTGAREAAVEWMQTRGGFGMLALFAPAPKKILVENAPDLGKTQFLFHEGKLEKTNTCALNMGTRITLFFPGFRDMTREKQILQIYCQSVQRDIRLNNRLISRRPLLFHQMATLKITDSEYGSGGLIGIPPTGDLCRVRLLDMGIPYRYVTLPPRKGFIFDAAVEYGNGAEEEITGGFLNHLAGYASRLYLWLCGHYTAAPPGIRGRIEELLFTHCRLTDDTSLMGHFAPFKVYQSSQTLSLQQIDRQRETARVFAVPRHKERLRYNTTGKTVLALTREHADFLINQRKLPLTFLPPVRRNEKRSATLFYSLKKGSKRFLLPFIRLFFKIKLKKVLALDQLTPSEQSFLHNLNRHLGREGALGAVMIAAGGLFPAIPPKRNKSGNRVSQPLLIRRNHSLVQLAISAVETDPDNVEIFIPLLEGPDAPAVVKTDAPAAG